MTASGTGRAKHPLHFFKTEVRTMNKRGAGRTPNVTWEPEQEIKSQGCLLQSTIPKNDFGTSEGQGSPLGWHCSTEQLTPATAWEKERRAGEGGYHPTGTCKKGGVEMHLQFK